MPPKAVSTPGPSRPAIAYSQRIDHGLAGNDAVLIQAGTPPGGRTPGGVAGTPQTRAGAASAQRGSVVRLFGADARERGNFAVRDGAGDHIGSIDQVMSADQDGGMIVRGGGRDDRFLYVDAETGATRGDVSVEWTPRRGGQTGGLAIQRLTSQRRGGQYRDRQSAVQLYGIGGAGDTLFTATYDSRVPGDKVQVAKEDAREFKMVFTACTTTADGYMVTGDNKGNVRLYNNTDRAVVVISQVAVNKPVIGVDVTDDGDFIVWTTEDAVHIVHYPEGAESWAKRGDVRPRALRLAVRDADLETILDADPEATFLPAKFDLESVDGGLTKCVVAYFGGFFVLWKMRTVTLAAKQLLEQVNEAEDPDSVPVLEVPSSRITRTTGAVFDHTPLRGEALDAASLQEGVQNIRFRD